MRASSRTRTPRFFFGYRRSATANQLLGGAPAAGMLLERLIASPRRPEIVKRCAILLLLAIFVAGCNSCGRSSKRTSKRAEVEDCASDQDCADDNPCSDERCVDGKCKFPYAEEGRSC